MFADFMRMGRLCRNAFNNLAQVSDNHMARKALTGFVMSFDGQVKIVHTISSSICLNLAKKFFFESLEPRPVASLRKLTGWVSTNHAAFSNALT